MKLKRKGSRKVIQMTPQVEQILLNQRQRFIKKFGREPGGHDPVFFREDSEEPTPLDPLLVETQLAAAMDEVGIDPAVAYAILKTGMIPVEDMLEGWSEKDLAEWQNAVEEYKNLGKH